MSKNIKNDKNGRKNQNSSFRHKESDLGGMNF
ncbi:hypothetical protein SAMN03097699_0924 [Flavobacteriaceae bacterium MAR_2010_188]|nr:hypothetical protein SAMN03097699_0924 [Flavobacteriaceae bacterium MAR_2010_188]